MVDLTGRADDLAAGSVARSTASASFETDDRSVATLRVTTLIEFMAGPHPLR